MSGKVSNKMAEMSYVPENVSVLGSVRCSFEHVRKRFEFAFRALTLF
jgi:hypothetical protein